MLKLKNMTSNMRVSKSGARIYNLLDKCILGILLAGVFLFILYPMLCVVEQSFIVDGRFTLDVYRGIFEGSSKLLFNSVFAAVLSAAASTVLALAAALCVRFSGRKISSLLNGILLVSMVSPPFIASLAYVQLFGRNGMITKKLLGLSVNPYGWHGVVLMQALFFTAVNAILLLSVLRKLDDSMIQASADLGASRSETLYRVIIPLIRPSLLICFLLSFIRSLSDFGTPIVIGGRFETIATEIYMQIIGYARLDRSAALNVILLVPSLLVFVAYRWLMKRNDKIFAGNSNKISSSESVYRLNGIAAWIVYPLGALFFIMMLLEYGAIFLSSFTKNIKGTLTFTTEYLERLFERNLDTFVRSVEYALIVAVVGTLIGIMISYYIERRKIRFGNAVDFIVTMPHMLPGSCFGIGYILAFNHAPLKLTGTAFIVVVNIIYKQMSVITKAVTAALTQINTNIDDAARDQGAHRLLVFFDVILPNLKQAFAAGFIQNFTDAMITVGSIIFLISPGQKVAVFTLFDSISSGRYGEASMISTCIILITVLVNLVFSKIFLKEGDRRNVS